MKVELVQANKREHDTLLRNLYQLYFYEFTRFMTHWRPTPAGRYEETDLDGCWKEDQGAYVFLIHADGEVAGFIMVDVGVPSHYVKDTITNYVVEFFVMAAFQRQGIGEQAAVQLFERFPGKWEISELAKNVNAQAFWRRIVGRYTHEQYREIIDPDDGEVVQMFDNSGR